MGNVNRDYAPALTATIKNWFHLGPEVMPWIASCIPGAKVVMISARHFVHLEKPVEFATAVRSFLEEIYQTSH